MNERFAFCVWEEENLGLPQFCSMLTARLINFGCQRQDKLGTRKYYAYSEDISDKGESRLLQLES